MAPSSMSVKRDRPRQITMLPGGESLGSGKIAAQSGKLDQVSRECFLLLAYVTFLSPMRRGAKLQLHEHPFRWSFWRGAAAQEFSREAIYKPCGMGVSSEAVQLLRVRGV